MANTITAGNGTNNGLAVTSDATGALNILTGSGGGTAAISIDSSQNVTAAANLTVTGNTAITGTLSATGGITGSLKSATAQASTSGTSIDFTSIPSGIKRITVMFSGVSLSGTSNQLIQIGAGSVTTSGYVGGAAAAGTSGSQTTQTAGLQCGITATATFTITGQAILTNITGNTWVMTFNGTRQTDGYGLIGSSSIALGGTLDRVRITTVNGTDTFDAGSINLIYE